MLIAVDDAAGCVMPNRPDEHSSLGVPAVGGCSHLSLKSGGWHAIPAGRHRLNSLRLSSDNPPTLAARQGLHKRWKTRRCAVPRLGLITLSMSSDSSARTARASTGQAVQVCGRWAKSSDVEITTRGRSPS